MVGVIVDKLATPTDTAKAMDATDLIEHRISGMLAIA